LSPLLLSLVVGVVGCNGSDTGAGNDTGACSSDSYWTGGNEESAMMNPGEACISCHSRGEGPSFTAAGTVMGDFADPNDCNGVDGVTVRLTDADGVVHEETTNSAGNFSFREAIAMPYTAEIENANGVSAMSGSQSEGDCATCHTAEGANGAPGRIVAP
jgi:hypothetical protein